MTVSYKDFNMKNLTNYLVVGLIFIVLIAVIHLFVSPLLVLVLPTVFTAPLTITETTLFLMLIHMFTAK